MKLWILLQFSHKHQLSHVFLPILQVLPFPPSAAWKDKWLGHGLGEVANGPTRNPPTLRCWNPRNGSGCHFFVFFSSFPQGFWWSFSMDSSLSWELRRSSCWRWVFLGVIFGGKKISQICLQIHVHSFCVCLKKYASLFCCCFFVVGSKVISLTGGTGETEPYITGTGMTTDKHKTIKKQNSGWLSHLDLAMTIKKHPPFPSGPQHLASELQNMGPPSRTETDGICSKCFTNWRNLDLGSGSVAVWTRGLSITHLGGEETYGNFEEFPF